MILFIDTETNGLPVDYKVPYTNVDNWPRVLQLAWCLSSESGESYLSECDMIKPDGWNVPNEAFWNDNNLTQSRAEKEGISIQEALLKLLIAISKAHTIVAHNIDFDIPILQAELIRANLTSTIPVELFCTMKSSTDICQIPGPYGFKWPRLEELYLWLWPKLTIENTHDAGQDVWYCRECYFELKNRGFLQPKPIGDITYSNIKRYDNLPAEQYFNLGGISHSWLKREKNGIVEKFEPSQKMLIGSLIDAFLTEPDKVNINSPHYEKAKKIAAKIKSTFGALIERFIPQVSYTAVMHYNGLQMNTNGRLDWLLPRHAVIDLKFTGAKTIAPIIEHFGYKNQLWNYAKMAEVKKAYIISYSDSTNECEVTQIDVSSNYNDFWANGILKHGKI